LRRLGIKQRYTNAYHPQTNGMDERLNGSLVKILRTYTVEKPSTWDTELKWALFAYNTAYHESVGTTPYAVMFGAEPRTPLNIQPSIALTHNEARRVIRQAAEANADSARRAKKYFYDRGRTQAGYQVGDSVLVRHHCLPREQSRKLQTKWTGPAIILRVHRNTPDGDPTYVEVINFKPEEGRVQPPRIQQFAICDIKPFYLRTDEEAFKIQQGVEDYGRRDAERHNRVYIPRDLLYDYDSEEEPPNRAGEQAPRTNDEPQAELSHRDADCTNFMSVRDDVAPLEQPDSTEPKDQSVQNPNPAETEVSPEISMLQFEPPELVAEQGDDQLESASLPYTSLEFAERASSTPKAAEKIVSESEYDPQRSICKTETSHQISTKLAQDTQQGLPDSVEPESSFRVNQVASHAPETGRASAPSRIPRLLVTPRDSLRARMSGVRKTPHVRSRPRG
jgi:hypothetical protein